MTCITTKIIILTLSSILVCKIDCVKSEQVVLNSPEAQSFLDKILSRDDPVPDTVDWRIEYGVVSKVKDQGHSCKAGWAFAAVGVLEGQETVQNTSMDFVELSAQNLVDCLEVPNACSGNVTVKEALEFVVKQHGVSKSKDYIYTGHKSKECHFEPKSVGFSADGAAILPEGDEENLKQVVANFGPVAVSIDASHLKWYRDGVYFNKNCKNNKKDLNHSVLIVGYGTDENQGDYWIIKNSWGNLWGLGGFGYIARNRGNHCGIASLATIPTFKNVDKPWKKYK